MIRYARGRDRFDATPVIREARDFDQFAQDVLSDRAKVKGMQYITAPMRVNGDGRPHRGKEFAEARRFLALDVDYIDGPNTNVDLRIWLARFKGFGFTTASSTPEAPRCRVVIALDRDVDRVEGMRLGAAIQRDIAKAFGDRVKLDPSTHRGEQPCYGPVVQSEAFHLDGDPLDVAAWLESAPMLEPERKGSAAVDPADDPVVVALKKRGMYRRDIGGGKHAIACPWDGEHTTDDPDTSSATAYFQPHHGGYVTPGFKCQHEHCLGRTGDDLLAFLGVDWRAVRDAYRSHGDGAGGVGLGPGPLSSTQGAREAPAPADEAIWAEPLDLFREAVAAPFVPEDLPPTIGNFARLFAESAGFDFGLVAMPMVVASASALDDRVRVLVNRANEWFESARLWGLTVDNPGGGKTPSLRAATRVIGDVADDVLKRWAALRPDGTKEPQEAGPPRLVTYDATVEKLADMLKDNERGMLYVAEEFDSWIGAHDAYRGGSASKDRGEWMRLFDGGKHTVDRIMRGSTFVPNWGVSITACTTHAALKRHAPKLGDDGLLARFIIAIGAGRRKPNHAILSAEVKGARDAYEARIRYLLEMPCSGWAIVRLSRDAYEIFEAERDRLMDGVDAASALSPALASHLAKHAAILARTALAFHAISGSGHPAETDISGETMALALRFTRKCRRHAAALYATMFEGRHDGARVARSLARSILAGKVQLLNKREAQAICRDFRGLEQRTQEEALSALVDSGWLRPEFSTVIPPHGAVWTVNPRAHEKFAAVGEAHARRRQAVRDILIGGSDD